MDWLAFAGSILGGLIGGLFTYFGVRLTLKHEMEKEKKEQILKADAEKPRLEIVKFLNFEETKHNRNVNNDCNVLMLDIKKFADDNGRARFFYDEQALKDENLQFVEYELKNTGLTEIADICITGNLPRNLSLIELERKETYITENFLNYEVWSNKRYIKPGQSLKLRIYYIKDQVEEYAKKAKFTEIAGSDVYYGGDTYSVSISLDSEEKKLSFVKKDELHIDNKIYKSSIEFPVPTEEQTYKVNHYINPLQKVTFNLKGETKDIGNFNLADIIFEYENKPEGSSEINKNAVLTVENSNVEIVIESAKKFYYDKKYCSVVGEKDFSELLNK